MIKQSDELGGKKSGLEVSVSTNMQIQDNLDEMINKIAEDKAQISQFSENIISGFDQPAVLVYLYNTIREQQGQKIMFYFEKTTQLGQLNVCSVSVTMNCSYDQLKAILESLSQGEYFIRVKNLTASRSLIEAPVEETPPEQPTEAVPPGDNTQPTDTTQPTEQPAELPEPEIIGYTLGVTMTLEFYNFDGSIQPDKIYPFTDGYSYGGDIFY